jgi:hypothetical protein
MRQMINEHNILVGNPEEKRLLGRPSHRWEDTFKIDLRGIRWVGGCDWINVAKGRNQRRAVVNTILKLRFHKRR